ncbi:cobalbumin biosynthesis protein [Arcobacter nitrofigilis DSM 7299]|uniref:Adenosylcobinamide kinase n=1 Tax=Arcobacter nitrofigilis (strain ATCC 33309 / DSM 7299 / CCUG 15893 / LMG 7604 / NCTC 12251 / CI) TaxID=572480 RepID=D5V1Q8_ARCNC|nr:bifunctional adenosylcobinamide kinase/adenosylcobinamide-phosphate guanylyltransferase [Arcobacter nitrofigilis]ADG93492.1 cobalbumin biosynthesis protein [Arcobacter nitrofigilis DSM 7299]
MKVLYFGGQKSGKSSLAETKTIELLKNKKPYYIATYDNSYGDKEMQNRVLKHQNQRKDKFETIEEKFDLSKVIEDDNTYLVDCISMWLLNALEKSEDELLAEIEKLASINANIVFVLNDVSSGVIPFEKVSRKYVDMSGIIGQKLASICDEVYEVKLGLAQRLK